MTTTDYAVRAHDLRKRYGGTPALDRLDLEVTPGTVHGLLGPNGAGKTTAVRILATLQKPDGGRAEVAGYDVVRHAAQVRYRIGLVGQQTAVDEELSGRENLTMFGQLYHLGRKAADKRAEELLDQFGLVDAAGRRAGHYSGGMRRRLDLAAGMILAPTVLFLDEPTTGLDPHGRNEVWQSIRALVSGGTTVLLTTQYLDEADQLADQISVLAAASDRGGRVIAGGTPDQLKAKIGGDRIDVVLKTADQLAVAAGIVGRATRTGPDGVEVDHDTRRVGAPVRDRMATLTEVVRAMHQAGIDAEDVTLRRPTLDEAFIHLTGSQPERDQKEGRELV